MSCSELVKQSNASQKENITDNKSTLWNFFITTNKVQTEGRGYTVIKLELESDVHCATSSLCQQK